ncbi:hypothetical protein [Phycicoccus ginsengisoli]
MTSTVEDRRHQVGVVLPDVPAPSTAHAPAGRAADLVLTSGPLPGGAPVEGEIVVEAAL